MTEPSALPRLAGTKSRQKTTPERPPATVAFESAVWLAADRPRELSREEVAAFLERVNAKLRGEL
jgi:hypothetical protein